MDKTTGILDITTNGKTICTMDTKKVDKNFEKIAKKINSLDKKTLENPSSSKNLPTTRSLPDQVTANSTLTTDGWTCIDSNIDMYWGFYYAIWQNDYGDLSWDAINGTGSLKMVDPTYGSNNSNLYSFADTVDSMLNNEYAFTIAITITVTTAILSFIFNNGGLTQAAFLAGAAALGLTGTVASYAWNISQNVKMANRYWGYLVE